MGKVGRSLAALFDIPYGAGFERSVGRTNLFAEPADPALRAGRRRQTPRAAALELFEQLIGTAHRVILLGPMVAGAFGVHDWMEWRRVRLAAGHLLPFSMDDPVKPALVVGALPYPAFENVWWADPGHAARARLFCRSALRAEAAR